VFTNRGPLLDSCLAPSPSKAWDQCLKVKGSGLKDHPSTKREHHH
jgi:hypothetical protein